MECRGEARGRKRRHCGTAPRRTEGGRQRAEEETLRNSAAEGRGLRRSAIARLLRGACQRGGGYATIRYDAIRYASAALPYQGVAAGRGSGRRSSGQGECGRTSGTDTTLQNLNPKP